MHGRSGCELFTVRQTILERMIDGLPPNLPQPLLRTISAGLLKIHSRKLEGEEVHSCLQEAYDVFAKAFQEGGCALSEDLLIESIPGWILRWAAVKRWWPLLYKHEHVDSPSPSGDPTFNSVLGPYRVSASAKQDILNRLASRIAYWQGEALLAERAVMDPIATTNETTPVSVKSLDNVEPPTTTNRRAAVNAFIQRVLEENSVRITRADIWRVAGYTEATEFERWQKHSKRQSPGTDLKISHVLRMKPAEFLEKRPQTRPAR